LERAKQIQQENKEDLLKTWKKLSFYCIDPPLPEIETRLDTESYAQALLFKSANNISRNGMLVKPGGLKVCVGFHEGKSTYVTLSGGSVVTRHRSKEE